MFQDQQEDGDAERTITLSRKDVSAARRLLKLLLGAERQSFSEFLEPPASPAVVLQRTVLTARARNEFHNRQRRAALFGQSMFGEPAWDMLLVLYILDMSGQRLTIGSLVQYSGHPGSTAKRWLDYLAGHRLVAVDAHPTDRRTSFVALTSNGRGMLDRYFSEKIHADK